VSAVDLFDGFFLLNGAIIPQSLQIQSGSVKLFQRELDTDSWL